MNDMNMIDRNIARSEERKVRCEGGARKICDNFWVPDRMDRITLFRGHKSQMCRSERIRGEGVCVRGAL